MTSSSVAERRVNELAGALTRVAKDPGLTRHLHEILGGYCHHCRNLLNSLKMSLYLARRIDTPGGDDVWSDLENRYTDLERFLDRLQLICRPLPVCPVRLPLGLLIEDRQASWSAELSARGKRLIIEPPSEPAVASFDPIRLGQGLDDLVAWRARIGDPDLDLRIHWEVGPGGLIVVWDEPARRGSPSRGGDETTFDLDPGAGPIEALTVPLLARVLTLHGGSVEEKPCEPWRLELRWPLDAKNTVQDSPRC